MANRIDIEMAGIGPNRQRRRVLQALAAAPLLASAGAPAQGLSSRPVRFLLAQTAATTPDVIARLIAPRFQARWNQPFIVENRGGAAGAIGMEALAKSAPDGHTVQIFPSSILTTPIFFPNAPFRIPESFTPVSMVCENNFALAVNSKLPVSNFREFLAYVKANPGVNYATPGNGTSHHLFMEDLKLAAGLQMTHIPYKGSAPAFTDLMSGQVATMFMPIHVAMGMQKDGRVRVLGGSMKERSPLFPDLPSIHEQGVPGFNGESWFGFWGPAGMAADVIARFGAELRAILAEPDMKDALAKQGISPRTSTPDGLLQVCRNQLESYVKLIRAANIKGD